MALSEDEELELLELEEAEYQASKNRGAAPEEGTPSAAKEFGAPVAGAAAVGGVLEGGRRVAEAAAPRLQNAAEDMEYRAIGGHNTPTGRELIEKELDDNAPFSARDVGRSSLDRGGIGAKSAADYRKKLIQGGADRDSIPMEILKQKVMKDVTQEKAPSMSIGGAVADFIKDKFAKRGTGAIARGLDKAGDIAATAGSKFARKIPLIGAIGGGLLSYEAARADGAAPSDAVLSAAGDAVTSLDPTGLTDATPTGPRAGSPEAMLEGGDRSGFLLARAPDRLRGTLQAAAAKGPEALATAHRILMDRDPEYAAAIRGE